MVRDKLFTSDLWKESKEQNSLILFMSLDFTHGKFPTWCTNVLQKDNSRQVGQRTKKANASRINHDCKHIWKYCY